jgi:WD40 repeat protein
MSRKQVDNSMIGHTDDITALAMSQDRTIVATGQNGISPLVFIWDSETALTLSSIKLPRGTRSVSALAFNKDNKYLAVCDMHNDHNVYVYSLAKA